MKTSKTICFVAGKSAGHILPALTLAQKIKLGSPSAKIIFFSNDTKLDQDLLKQNPIITTHIPLPLMALPYKKPWKLASFSWQMVQSLWSCYRILKKSGIKKIITTGGLIAVPVCLAAKYLKIPIEIYELNVTPGKATKFLVSIASQVNICFAQTSQFLPKINCLLVPYPSRFDQPDYTLSKTQALQIINKDTFKFRPEYKTILILGGSQGSSFINQLIPQFILREPKINLQIIHQTGAQITSELSDFYQKNHVPAIVFDYQTNLMPYYKVADLIICRAGAGTLAEIIPLKTNCITIPLATGYTSHQVENALAVALQHPKIKVVMQDEIVINFELFYNLVTDLITSFD